MFYKILDENSCADSVVHRLGLNVGPITNIGALLVQKELNYTDLEHICNQLRCGVLIAEVEPKGRVNLASDYDRLWTTNELYVHYISPIADWFENQSDEVKGQVKKSLNFAICNSPHSIKLYKNPTEEQKRDAISRDGQLISRFDDPSEELQLEAVRNNLKFTSAIKNPTEAIQMYVISRNEFLIRHIENPTERVQLFALEYSSRCFECIKNPTEAAYAFYQKRMLEEKEAQRKSEEDAEKRKYLALQNNSQLWTSVDETSVEEIRYLPSGIAEFTRP